MENLKKISYILLIFLILISINSISGANIVDIQDSSFYNDPALSLSNQIQKIIDAALEGTTINFLGTNYVDLTLIINKSLNIISSTGTTIQNSNSLNAVFFINGSSASGTNISGFNIINDNINGNGITLNNTKNIIIKNNHIKANGSSIAVNGSSNITINNNSIEKSNEGISVKDTQDITIEKNTIEENNEGIYLENTTNTNIKNNKINKSKKNGISLKNTKKTTIENNNITNNNNGIYLFNTENTQIDYNNIENNIESGILAENNAKNLDIRRNNISDNHYGIRLDSSDNSNLIIKSNSINRNYEGVSFSLGYVDHKSKDISSNDLSGNIGRSIEAKESNYYESLGVGPNWYGANDYAYTNICPKLQTGLIQFNFVSSGNGIYTGTLTYNGKIMSDLPPMTLLIRFQDERMWVNIEGGKVTVDFGSGFDEKNRGSIIETYLNNQRGKLAINYNKNAEKIKSPIMGGNGNGGSGNGGSGIGYGIGSGNTQRTGVTNGGVSGAMTTPGDSGSSSSSSGNMANAQSSQQVKEIAIDDYNILKMDDTRLLTAFIIILLFGSIVIGYISKKRAKKSL